MTFFPFICSLSHVSPRYITETSFHFKHVHLQANALLAVPSGLKDSGHSYAWFACLPKGKFGAELESTVNF